jgi:hypothetical protein
MPDIEQSIAEWRRQMLAAGIKMPGPLEELESHLREEIEQQMKLGLTEQVAFHSAIQIIGQASLLKKEFDQAGGFGGSLGDNKFVKANLVLGVFWVAQGVWFLTGLFPLPGHVDLSSKNWPSWGHFILAIAIVAALAGVWGGVCLIRGTKSGRTIIGCTAVLGVSLCPLQIPLHLFNMSSFPAWITIFAAFDLITFWLLFSPKHRNSQVAK